MGGLEEILETVAGYVDDLWKLESSIYTEERMKILLNIIGNEIPSLVHILLAEVMNNITITFQFNIINVFRELKKFFIIYLIIS